MNRLARVAGFGIRSENGADEVSPAVAVEHLTAEELREPIIAALRSVYDPEIPVNLYDLGLIYDLVIAPNGDVAIDMSLTAPACPVAGMMPTLVRDAVRRVEGVGEVTVRLVWEPPWSTERMSDEARLQLGLL